MGWISRFFSGWIADGDNVIVSVGNYPGVVVISVGGIEALPSPDEARTIAQQINEAANRAEHRGQVWGFTAGRLPEGKVMQ